MAPRQSHPSGFTAIELVVAVLILLVLVSFSMAGYQRYNDRAMMLKDEMNQKVIRAGLELSAYDNNSLPGSLSELDPRYLERAYALVTEGKRPYTFFAFLQEQMGLFDIAEAVPLQPKYYNNDISLLTCPSDPTPPAEGGVSYALASGWENRPLSALLDPRNEDSPLIIEADERVNGRVVFRHGQGTLTVQTTVKGEQKRQKGKAASPEEYLRKAKKHHSTQKLRR